MADNEKLTNGTEESAEKIVKKSPAKPQKPKKNRMKKIGKFMADTFSELKKIIWPTFPTVVRNTVVTLVLCGILGIIICGIDIGLSALINLALSLG